MQSSRRGFGEFIAVTVVFVGLAIALIYPLSLNLSSLARIDNGDGQYSIWNVAWVARALTTNPRGVLDANIFYPRRRTLVYSEANLGAGALAAPVYWLTRNAYVATNFVIVLSFVLSGVSMYYLVRYLTADRRAAMVSAIGFAFAPHVFSHMPHIQLLLTAGIPLSLLAFHRLADEPTAWRAVVLGLAMAAQAYACAYYAIFLMLIVGFGTLTLAITRRLWRSPQHWRAIVIAAATAAVLTAPLALLYISFQQATGFQRTLADARQFSADWRAYLASSAYLHKWMLPLLGHWAEVLFPGFTMTIFGAVGVIAGYRSGARGRELALLYGALAGLAFWTSLGPAGGLYSALYAVVPGFTFLRAAGRVGLIVTFSLAVLGGLGVSRVLTRFSVPNAIAAALTVFVIVESIEALSFRRVPPVSPAYQLLAAAPRGAVLELPVFSHQFKFLRVRYMLASTAHWQPLVNAYSDYIPASFIENEGVLGLFPSAESFELLKRDGVRYAVFHVNDYDRDQLAKLRPRLRCYRQYMRKLFADQHVLLYEIVGYP